MAKKLQQTIILVFCTILIFTSVALAGETLMTYKGKGIRDKMSVDSFKLTKKTKYVVSHKTTNDCPNNLKMQIRLMKKNSAGAWKYADKKFTQTGKGSSSATWTDSKGNYRLHFYIPKPGYGSWGSMNIEGTVKKK